MKQPGNSQTKDRLIQIDQWRNDFGVDSDSVKTLIKSIPPLELELMLAILEITNHSGNFRRLVEDAGLLDAF